MWHFPINGSQINQPAKLYKKFTPTENVTLNKEIPSEEEEGETTIESRTIIVENNYYRTYASIAYVEATDRQEGEEQPLRGLPSHSASMTIKYNGAYKPKRGSVYECEADDILLIDGELWIVEDGIQRVRHKSLVNFATVYVPIRRLL